MNTTPATIQTTTPEPAEGGVHGADHQKAGPANYFRRQLENSSLARFLADRFMSTIVFIDSIYSSLEGDRDQEIVDSARAFQESLGEPSGQGSAHSARPLSTSRFAILPARSFHTVDLDLPTKSPGEAKKIAALQLDRLTAVPVQEAIFALARIEGEADVSPSQSYRVYITRRRLLSEIRQSGDEFAKAEAMVAFSAGQDNKTHGAVFRDDAAQRIRAVRRAKHASLIILTASLFAGLVWSVSERLDRELAATQSATQKAVEAKKEAQLARTNELEALSALQRGPIELSADRALVTLAELTKRQPAKAVIQSISIAEGRVKISGSALDPNAARLAFSTQSGAAAPPSNPQAPQLGLPVPGPVTSPMQPAGPSVTPVVEAQWQPFDVEISAAPLARIGAGPGASNSQTPDSLPRPIPGLVAPGPLPGPGGPPQ